MWWRIGCYGKDRKLHGFNFETNTAGLYLTDTKLAGKLNVVCMRIIFLRYGPVVCRTNYVFKQGVNSIIYRLCIFYPF